MPSVANANLALTIESASSVKLTVEYDAIFSQFDRNLAAMGLIFRERITPFGDDPSNDDDLSDDVRFVDQNLPVTEGTGTQTIHRVRQVIASRAALQEDNLPGDDDEIYCRIAILPVNFPVAVSKDTPVWVLGN